MADIRGYFKLGATILGLALLCVLGYFVLLYLVSPHPSQVNHPVPSDLPPGAQVHPGGYVIMPAANVTIRPGDVVDNSGADGTVTFFQLPLWIQLYALPGIIFGIVTSFLAAALVVRHFKNENANKQSVLAFVKGNPGCTAPELARGQDMNLGTARYHIQRLQDEGRIVLNKIGKFSRIFVNSQTFEDREKRIASHLHNETSLKIISALIESPGISNQMLSEKLGMEKSLAYRYMQKLLEDGIVMFEWEGKNKLYYIDMSAKETLIKLMPLHYQCPGLKKE